MRENNVLVVWKLDRLASSLKQLIETVEALELHRVGFQSITESIDTVSVGGKLVFQIFGALVSIIACSVARFFLATVLATTFLATCASALARIFADRSRSHPSLSARRLMAM